MDSVNQKATYGNPIGMTQQFRFCGNPLRIDMYKDCGFQCNYCFAKSMAGRSMKINCADINDVKRLFERAFDSDKKSSDITIELLRRKTPLHCGGLSDPFQPYEFKKHLTYELIKLSNKYQIPITFSTKQCELPKEYWDILDPKIHAFQISLIGFDEEWIRQYEPFTPTPQQRLNFMKQLHEKGFWVGMRIQPLIDIEQAEKVSLYAQDFINYITIEHLKIAPDSKWQSSMFNFNSNDPYYYRPKFSRYYSPRKDIKEANIKRLLKVITKCKVGVGDNDFHHLSQSRCCCGIDTIGGAFDNYLKYNATYFVTGDKEMTLEEKDSLYVPQNNCTKCFNSDCSIKGITLVKDYVDKYCADNVELLKNKKKLYDYYYNFFTDWNTYAKFSRNEIDKEQMSIFDFMEEDKNE